MAWTSEDPNVGSGSQKITAAEPYALVKTFLDFGEHGTADAAFRLEAVADGQTRVTWAFETDLGYNPVARYMGLMFDGMVGAEFLKVLRRYVENPVLLVM